MSIRLLVLDGKHQGRVIKLPPTQFIIGRDAKCHLRPTSSDVSRHHCALVCRGNYLQVCDFHSVNGTFVNDEPVERIGQAWNGDVLRVGPLRFQVQVTEAPESAGDSVAGWLMRKPNETEQITLDPKHETQREIPVFRDEDSASPERSSSAVGGDYLEQYLRRRTRKKQS